MFVFVLPYVALFVINVVTYALSQDRKTYLLLEVFIDVLGYGATFLLWQSGKVVCKSAMVSDCQCFRLFNMSCPASLRPWPVCNF
jgi:hypothetical protein